MWCVVFVQHLADGFSRESTQTLEDLLAYMLLLLWVGVVTLVDQLSFSPFSCAADARDGQSRGVTVFGGNRK